MHKPLFVGLDTSNYTTSIAILDEEANRLWDKRIPLDVALGDRGLRQQEAVFQHIRHISGLVEQMTTLPGIIHTVTASVKPRMTEKSYMPVFEVSKHLGLFLAGITSARFISTSHQRGHIRVALEAAEQKASDFLVFHISGGTTECLLGRFDGLHMEERLIGATADISAGQLIDRIGVRMGMTFPAGKAMDGLLEDGKRTAYEETYAYKGSFKEGVMNLSGLENHLNMRLDRGDPLDHVAYATFRNVADVLELAGVYFATQAGVTHIFMTGGVCANSLIRARLTEGWSKRGLQGMFCSKPDCTDNAVGNALIGLDHYKRSEA